MVANKSEILTARLLGNSFLKLYVYANPQIQAEGEQNAVELCDVLISFHGMAIFIEVKEFNPEAGTSKPDDWLKSKVFYKARKQLTRSCEFLRRRHKVFDKKTKRLISTTSWEAVMTVIVFDRDDVGNYSYTRALPDDDKYCGVNIFSMKDFRLATKQIPTPLDFFRYLEKRYLSMRDGNHLFPLVQTPNGIHIPEGNGLTDEVVLITDYLLNNSKNLDGNVGPAKAIIRSGEQLYRLNADADLLHLLSCVDMKVAEGIDEIRKELIEKTEDNALAWNGQFVQSGFDFGKIGIAIAYSKLPSTTISNYDKLKSKICEVGNEYGIETIYVTVFHDGNIYEIRKVK